MNDDLTFSPVQYSTEERIKGNKTQGFRSIPLTPQAQEIITKTLKLNPDGDFLFMKDGQSPFMLILLTNILKIKYANH